MQKRKDYREFISLPLYNRILMFSELTGNESLLFSKIQFPLNIAVEIAVGQLA